jgi:phasin family protein
MYATPTQFVELQKSQLEALYALSHVAFSMTEKLVDLNLAAVKAAMDESAAKTQALLGVRDAQELFSINGMLAQPTFEKVVGYSRNVYGIVSGAGAEAREILESHIAEGNGKVAQLVEFASKNAPAGSESVVSMFRNAVAASSNAYDTFNKAAQQAADAAESNFTAATQATVKAVSSANDAVKFKGKKAA